MPLSTNDRLFPVGPDGEPPAGGYQISVPGELAKSLWKVTVQSVDGNGEPLPLKQDLITSQDRYAYTATPPTPDSRIVVVEVAQGAAFSATGNPDDVQTVTKALWSLQVQPG